MEKCTKKSVGQWIALYEFGALNEQERKIFTDHMIECEYCHAQVYSLDPVMTAFRKRRSAARSGEVDRSADLRGIAPARKSSRAWYSIPAFAMLLAVIIIGGWAVYLTMRGPETVPPTNGDGPTVASAWEDLEIPKAAYTPPIPGINLRVPSRAFQNAMVSYQQNDFPRAIEQLEILSELEPANAAEVDFYLGVSLLLAGRSQEAISPLKQAVQASNGQQRESRHYYLALAYLKRDEPQQATAELDAVVGMGGEYSPAAKALKQQIIDRTK